jgi:hypothetical protein
VLLILTVAQFALSIAAARQPNEVDFGEAILYDHAARLVRGEPLYQPLDRPPYTVAAYTPLYYALAAILQAVVGPGFGAGRVLSILAGLVAAGLVAYLAGHVARDRRAGVFAALLFLTLGFPGPFAPWFALYKEDTLGVAFSLGMVAILVGGQGWQRVLVSAVLGALAILTKQPFGVAVLGVTGWLWCRDRRVCAMFSVAWVTIVAGTLGALELSTHAFIANAVIANAVPFSRLALAENLPTVVRFQGGLIAIAVLYLLRPGRWPRPAETSLLAWFWLASAVLLVGLAAVGSNHNYWMLLGAANAVLGAVALWAGVRELRTWVPQPLPPGITPTLVSLVPLLLVGANVLAALSPLSRGTLIELSRPKLGETEAFGQLVERVRTEPLEVMANPLDVIVLAGRPVTFEPHFFTILQIKQVWDPRPVVRRICRGEIGLLVLEQPMEEGVSRYHGYAHWPVLMRKAFAEAMVPDGQLAGRFLYVPAVRPGTPGQNSNSTCQMVRNG